MDQGLPWKMANFSPDEEIICFYKPWLLTTVLAKADEVQALLEHFGMYKRERKNVY
jgi:hypothetical protein